MWYEFAYVLLALALLSAVAFVKIPAAWRASVGPRPPTTKKRGKGRRRGPLGWGSAPESSAQRLMRKIPPWATPSGIRRFILKNAPERAMPTSTSSSSAAAEPLAEPPENTWAPLIAELWHDMHWDADWPAAGDAAYREGSDEATYRRFMLEAEQEAVACGKVKRECGLITEDKDLEQRSEPSDDPLEDNLDESSPGEEEASEAQCTGLCGRKVDAAGRFGSFCCVCCHVKTSRDLVDCNSEGFPDHGKKCTSNWARPTSKVLEWASPPGLWTAYNELRAAMDPTRRRTSGGSTRDAITDEHTRRRHR